MIRVRKRVAALRVFLDVLVRVDHGAHVVDLLLAVLVTQELAFLAAPAHDYRLLAHVAAFIERVAPAVLRRRVHVFLGAVRRGRVRLVRVRLDFTVAETRATHASRRKKDVVRRGLVNVRTRADGRIVLRMTQATVLGYLDFFMRFVSLKVAKSNKN